MNGECIWRILYLTTSSPPEFCLFSTLLYISRHWPIGILQQYIIDGVVLYLFLKAECLWFLDVHYDFVFHQLKKGKTYILEIFKSFFKFIFVSKCILL